MDNIPLLHCIKILSSLTKTESARAINTVNKDVPMSTTMVALISSSRVDQETFLSSCLTSLINVGILLKKFTTLII